MKSGHTTERLPCVYMLSILMETVAFRLYTFLGGDASSYQMALNSIIHTALVHENNWSLTKICHSETFVLFYF